MSYDVVLPPNQTGSIMKMPSFNLSKLFKRAERDQDQRTVAMPKLHTQEELAMMAVKATDAELFTPEHNKRVLEIFDTIMRGEKLPDIPVDPHIKAIRDARNKATYLEYKKHEIL